MGLYSTIGSTARVVRADLEQANRVDERSEHGECTEVYSHAYTVTCENPSDRPASQR